MRSKDVHTRSVWKRVHALRLWEGALTKECSRQAGHRHGHLVEGEALAWQAKGVSSFAQSLKSSFGSPVDKGSQGRNQREES